MPTELDIDSALGFSIQQIFAESYWEKYIEKKLEYDNNPTTDTDLIIERKNELNRLAKYALVHGNSKEVEIKDGGYTKLTETLADAALIKYEVVSCSEPDATGFSAILLREKTSGKLTLAMRSTEYKVDFFRDAQGADVEILDSGFAYGQISAMEKYYNKLITENIIPLDSSSPTGHKLVNVSGYSLGGHLAYAFYAMHADAVEHVYTQNAAGIGYIGTAGNDAKTLSNYKTQLTNAVARYDSIKTNFLNGIFGIDHGITEANYNALLLGLTTDPENANYFIYNGNTSDNKGVIGNNIASKINLYSRIGQNNTLQMFKEAITKAVLIVGYTGEPYVETKEDNPKTIYTDPRYQISINAVKIEFNSYAHTAFSKIFSKAGGQEGGEVSDSIFNPAKFTTISGRANGFDPNFVSKSNLHSEVHNVFIEDHPEIIGFGGRLPGFLYTVTKNNTGDFGNTHSLTTLVDSLRAMQTLMKLDSTLTQSKLESLLASSANTRAYSWVSLTNPKATESISISNLINSLTRLLVDPLWDDTPFTRKPDSLGEVTNRDIIHRQEDRLIEDLNNNQVTIKLLYDSSKTLTTQFTSVSEMVTKSQLNTAEGMAYRYALREMNNFVVLGADYASLNTNGRLDVSYHSQLWYQARAEILFQNLHDNVDNTDKYGIQASTQVISGTADNYYIIDDISFRKRTYENSTVIVNKSFENVAKIMFNNDNPIAVNFSLNPGDYTDSTRDDKIFMGNGYNSAILNGGSDKIETGHGYNIIEFSSRTVEIELNLFGTNIIRAKPLNGNGKIYINKTLLSGGDLQSDGSYIDSNYSNITYKTITLQSSVQGLVAGTNVLEISFTNPDNSVNKTLISGYNLNSQFLGMTFSKTYTAVTAGASISLVDNVPKVNVTDPVTHVVTEIVKNPYTMGLFTTMSPTIPPPPDTPFITAPTHDVATIEGGTIYFYIDSIGGGYSADASLVSNASALAAPVNYSYSSGTKFYKPGDKIIVEKNLEFLNVSINRVGNDLIFQRNPLSSDANHATTPEIIGRFKNYFQFDHSGHTNIFTQNLAGTVFTEISQSDLLKYDILIGTNGNDTLTSSTHKTLYGGYGGNDTLISGSLDTTFLSFPAASTNYNYTNYNSTYNELNTGNDVMISGTGNNKFVFASTSGLENNGQDIIKNIKITDKIVFSLTSTGNLTQTEANYWFANKKLTRQGNNLLITSKATPDAGVLTIENYYTVFGDKPVHSGIYIENLNGVSQEIDITEFEVKRLSESVITSNSQGLVTIASSSIISEINIDSYASELSVEKDNTTISSSGGIFKQKISYQSLTTSTTTVANIINLDLSDSQGYEMEVNNFNSKRDSIQISSTSLSNIITNRIEDDLVIRKLNGSEVLATVKLTDFFIDNYDISNLTKATNIFIYNATIGSALTVGDLQGLLAPFEINSSLDEDDIVVGNINKNTIIHASGNNVSITGGKFNDDITGGNDSDVFHMSKGRDTYNLTSTSGLDMLVYDKELINQNSSLVIQFDSSLDAEDISFYYDHYQQYFTIKTGTNSGLVLTNFDQESVYYVEQIMKVKLNNGDNLFDETFMISNGSPLFGEEYHANIVIGTSGNNTLQSVVGKNSLVFGGDGNDTISGNLNTIASGKTDYTTNILVGGKGNDSISAGSYDLILAREGDGADTISYSTNHDDFVLSVVKNNTTNQAFGVKTVSNDLELYYANNTTDKMVIKDFWTKTREDMALALVDKDNLNTNMRVYSIDEIMSEMGYNKTNTGSTIHYVDYDEIQDILMLQDNNKLVGGELAEYYADLGQFTGFALSGALTTLNELDDKVIMKKTGYNDPNDYRTVT